MPTITLSERNLNIIKKLLKESLIPGSDYDDDDDFYKWFLRTKSSIDGSFGIGDNGFVINNLGNFYDIIKKEFLKIYGVDFKEFSINARAVILMMKRSRRRAIGNTKMLVSLEEVLDPIKEFKFDFISIGCIPLIDLFDNNFLVYIIDEELFGIINITESENQQIINKSPHIRKYLDLTSNKLHEHTFNYFRENEELSNLINKHNSSTLSNSNNIIASDDDIRYIENQLNTELSEDFKYILKNYNQSIVINGTEFTNKTNIVNITKFMRNESNSAIAENKFVVGHGDEWTVFSDSNGRIYDEETNGNIKEFNSLIDWIMDNDEVNTETDDNILSINLFGIEHQISIHRSMNGIDLNQIQSYINEHMNEILEECQQFLYYSIQNESDYWEDGWNIERLRDELKSINDFNKFMKPTTILKSDDKIGIMMKSDVVEVEHGLSLEIIPNIKLYVGQDRWY